MLALFSYVQFGTSLLHIPEDNSSVQPETSLLLITLTDIFLTQDNIYPTVGTVLGRTLLSLLSCEAADLEPAALRAPTADGQRSVGSPFAVQSFMLPEYSSTSVNPLFASVSAASPACRPV